jgi:hypothetical protein
MLNKFSVLYGIQSFVTIFTRTYSLHLLNYGPSYKDLYQVGLLNWNLEIQIPGDGGCDTFKCISQRVFNYTDYVA